ncbi:MAG: MGH1-like glycoside hydrolase domain-containing protein [Bacteroidales bacterium]
MNRILLTSFILTLLASVRVAGQKFYQVQDEYLKIEAEANSPLYTTYTAAIQRSRLYGDKGYKMDYYNDCSPLSFEGDQAGRFFHLFKINKVVIFSISEFFRRPTVVASFPDMAVLEYQPWPGLRVEQAFLVYSSSLAVVELMMTNSTRDTLLAEVYPVLELGNDSLHVMGYDSSRYALVAEHRESYKRLISNLYRHGNYPRHCRNIFGGFAAPYSYGSYFGTMTDFYNFMKTDFYAANIHNDSLNMQAMGFSDFISLHFKYELAPGQTVRLRYYRGWQDISKSSEEIYNQIEKLNASSLQSFIDDNIRLFARIPRIPFSHPDDKMVYLGAFNLARGCMLPPEGKTSHNYYVFSRQPLWGWGHGHQVLHESLSMLAYVYLDPRSAMESQWVYIEQQDTSGLIAYRHGPRGKQDYPHKGMPTTSAPFFNWINLEIFKVSHDSLFLKEAYESGSRYLRWLYKNRDSDQDGTFEWGPYGLIENVRDWYNVIFQVSKERFLDIDKEDISDELECLDLSLMVLKELKSLSEMAGLQGLLRDKRQWDSLAVQLQELINERFWDPETQFFYHVDKQTHQFRFLTRDLRRQEIIGFLPLWAKAVDHERAAILVKHLTDTTRFWRKYGVPTLSARDSWYSPNVDYCCKWNGPVWLLWDYMVFVGLKQYGYYDLAQQLADKMMLAAKTQLVKNHNFWESYSPDNEILNSPPNYIWDSILARLLIDCAEMNHKKID